MGEPIDLTEMAGRTLDVVLPISEREHGGRRPIAIRHSIEIGQIPAKLRWQRPAFIADGGIGPRQRQKSLGQKILWAALVANDGPDASDNLRPGLAIDGSDV